MGTFFYSIFLYLNLGLITLLRNWPLDLAFLKFSTISGGTLR